MKVREFSSFYDTLYLSFSRYARYLDYSLKGIAPDVHSVVFKEFLSEEFGQSCLPYFCNESMKDVILPHAAETPCHIKGVSVFSQTQRAYCFETMYFTLQGTSLIKLGQSNHVRQLSVGIYTKHRLGEFGATSRLFPAIFLLLSSTKKLKRENLWKQARPTHITPIKNKFIRIFFILKFS